MKMIKQCCICGKEFETNRPQQITCSSDECQKARHRQTIKKHQQTDEYKERHQEANRSWRQKSYGSKMVYNTNKNEERMRKMKQERFDKLIAEVGDHYGEWQAQQTLKMVEPIKLEL